MTNTISFPTLNCSKENPQFCYLLGELNQLIQTCTFLLNENKFQEACLLFSHIVEGYIIKLPNTNLDTIDYTNISHGKYASKTSVILKKLIEIWRRIQEEQITCVTGAKTEFDSNIFKTMLKNIDNKVESML